MDHDKDHDNPSSPLVASLSDLTIDQRIWSRPTTVSQGSTKQSGEMKPPTTPMSKTAHHAHMEQQAQSGSSSQRRTVSDTTHGPAVPLLYTELYHGNGLGNDMSPARIPGSDTVTYLEPSPYKSQIASSPGLETLPEVDSSPVIGTGKKTSTLGESSLAPADLVNSRKERSLKSFSSSFATVGTGDKGRNVTAHPCAKLPFPGHLESVTETSGDADKGKARMGHYKLEYPEKTSPTTIGSGQEGHEEPFDPQRAYPSDACIFVANLLESAPDETLAEQLTLVFGRYGTVFVKIKRKASNMPYAFVQYTNVEDARNAAEKARGAKILDRVCRMEPANSKRFWLVRRADGTRTSVAEVEKTISGLGTATVQEAPSSILNAFDVRQAIRVEFTQWDQARDLRRSLGDEYIVELLDEYGINRRQLNAVAAQARITRRNDFGKGFKHGNDAGSASEQTSSGSNAGHWGSFMERYDRNRRSVYCGNLPSNTTESELRAIFAQTSETVKGIEIVRGPHSSYAFVEFDRADACETAIRCLNGNDLRGMSMKVERRKTPIPESAVAANNHRFQYTSHRRGGMNTQFGNRGLAATRQANLPAQEEEVRDIGKCQDDGAQQRDLSVGSPPAVSSPTPLAQAAAAQQDTVAVAQQMQMHAYYNPYLQYFQNGHQQLHGQAQAVGHQGTQPQAMEGVNASHEVGFDVRTGMPFGAHPFYQTMAIGPGGQVYYQPFPMYGPQGAFGGMTFPSQAGAAPFYPNLGQDAGQAGGLGQNGTQSATHVQQPNGNGFPENREDRTQQ